MAKRGLADPPLPRRGRPQHRRPAQDRGSPSPAIAGADRHRQLRGPRLQPRHRVRRRQRSSACRRSVGTQADAQNAVERAIETRRRAGGRRGRRRAAGRQRRRRHVPGPHLGADPAEQADGGQGGAGRRTWASPPTRSATTGSAAAWGAQVTQQALIGLVIFLVLVMIYLVLRFEWRMAVAAVASLLLEPDPHRRRLLAGRLRGHAVDGDRLPDDPRLRALRRRRGVRQGPGEHPRHHRRAAPRRTPRRPTWPSTRR